MAPPSWAYQIEFFDPPPDDELVCSVCRGVFCDPIQSPCNHVFCRSCLFKWLENNRTCPICRKRIFKPSVQEVVPLVKNMIMKLILRCRNWENQCREKFTLEACEAHMKVCAFEMMLCRNKPCKMMLTRKDLKEHEQNCSHRTVKCPKCYLKVPTKEHSHDCIKALKQKVKARDEDIKKKNKKIKELENELAKMHNVRQAAASDVSSFGDVSAADILIDLEDMQSTSSSSSDLSSLYNSDGYGSRWIDFLDDSSRSNSVGNFFYDSDALNVHPDDSIDFPRASAPEAGNDSSFLATDASVSLEEEPMTRRPVKRRHPFQTADSSDEDNNNQGLPSLPSPKRSWNNSSQRENDASRRVAMRQNDLTSDSAAGPSLVRIVEGAASLTGGSTETGSQLPSRTWKRVDKSEGAAGSSHEGTSTACELNALRCNAKDSNKSKDLFPASHGTKKLFKDLSSTPVSNRCPPQRIRSSPVFERTLAMLEQYNLESEDDEWRPPGDSSQLREASSDSDVESEDSFHTTGPSSYCDSSSSDSSIEVPSRRDWFTRLFENEPDSDPDWNPE